LKRPEDAGHEQEGTYHEHHDATHVSQRTPGSPGYARVMRRWWARRPGEGRTT
jgi:hypothetical protein